MRSDLSDQILFPVYFKQLKTLPSRFQLNIKISTLHIIHAH